MSLQIRKAVPSDASEVAHVIQASGVDDNPNTARIASVIAGKDAQHDTIVALENETVVGFADAFSTISHDGVVRGEIDLLGVVPAQQGRGIARKLISNVIEQLERQSIQHLRALIRTSNIPSQRCFAACGFVSQPIVRRLYIAEPFAGNHTPSITQTHIVEVDTLTYSGLWLEGILTRDALKQAIYVAHHQGRDTVGALISDDDQEAMRLAEQEGYSSVGEFVWWMRA